MGVDHIDLSFLFHDNEEDFVKYQLQNRISHKLF